MFLGYISVGMFIVLLNQNIIRLEVFEIFANKRSDSEGRLYDCSINGDFNYIN